MKWTKLSEKHPLANKEYHVRNKEDKWSLYWDHEEREFYMIEQNCHMTYFSKEEFPNLEWLDESSVEITDKEMVKFAHFCGTMGQLDEPKLYWRNFKGEAYTTEELLEMWKRQQIPKTID